MDRRTPPDQNADTGTVGLERGSGADACAQSPTAGGKIVALGRVFVRTVRHFAPGFNAELDRLPDTRFEPMICYHKRFLAWWGLLLFCFKLGSRRQLDYQMRDLELSILENVNRLAGTAQETLPVHKTLNHFLGHVGAAAFAALRTWLVRRLIRMRALDACRLLGKFVIAVDGTGFLHFHHPHCAHCLTQTRANGTLYLHPVLEAKLVHTSGLALSVGTEFIENPWAERHDHPSQPPTLDDYEKIKQDCELKALARLAPVLKRDFPQTPLCISGDSLLACGPVLCLCEQHRWSYVLTFKAGRTPALWADFQGLLKLAPENRHRVTLPDGTRQQYRWVNGLDYLDSEGHAHRFNAILCVETAPDGQTTTFAWITDLEVNEHTLTAIAEQGGRNRWKIENQGFNTQKNSGLNLTHAYSIAPENLKAFYYLLQCAHIFLQLFESGSLLLHLAQRYGQPTARQLFGSLANIAQFLRDSFRYWRLPDEVFDPHPGQIRLNTS